MAAFSAFQPIKGRSWFGWSCPIGVLERSPSGGRIAAIRLSARCPSVDNTERRLDGRQRHVVSHYRLGEALEGERAKLFSCDASLECDVDKLAEQDLA